MSWWAFESFVHELCNSAGCFLGESSLLEHSAGHCADIIAAALVEVKC